MRRGTRITVAVLATALLVGLAGGPIQARPAPARAKPVFQSGFADPSVVRYAGGYLAISTGPNVPRAISSTPNGPWRRIGPALPHLPRWARADRSVWASDLVPTRTGWRLFYSAAVGGGDRRCIGVATARHALDPFRPIGRRPLVCPRQGAIDPSGFTGSHGRRYLLFKTQGLPTSIRLLPLTRDGRHRARHAQDRMLLRSRHVVENPVLVQRGRDLVLFTSEGDFGSCDYRTTWRRSRNLLHLRRTAAHPLLRRANTGVCGPGGADVVADVVYFHGWTCAHGRRPCPARPAGPVRGAPALAARRTTGARVRPTRLASAAWI